MEQLAREPKLRLKLDLGTYHILSVFRINKGIVLVSGALNHTHFIMDIGWIIYDFRSRVFQIDNPIPAPAQSARLATSPFLTQHTLQIVRDEWWNPRNSGGWSRFNGRQLVLELACVLDEYQPRIKGETHCKPFRIFFTPTRLHLLESPFNLCPSTDSGRTAYFFCSNPPSPPLCKSGELLLPVTRVMDNLE